MLFNSFAFLIYFPVVCGIFFALPHRFRWMWLLAASAYFYATFVPAYLLILVALILVDYTVGIFLEKLQGAKRRWCLYVSLFANIGLLFVFKYFNFFNENIGALAHALHWNYSISALSLLLPIGLSFHTFQSLSYIIEVYRGNQKAERHLGIYALYVLFFPQLVAGPIERPQNMLHQFYEKHVFEATRVIAGLRLMTWGFFQKVVIADTAAVFVNIVFGTPESFTGWPLILAILLFAFQAYGDFAGYSNIARGCAQVLGFKLMVNFDKPYSARSVAEFWRRWHISLSTWLKDYVYFPLVRSIRHPGIAWICFSLFVTFLLSGLWHGAGWTFVVMGALHGTYLVSSQLTKSLRAKMVTVTRLARFPRLHAVLQTLFVLLLVCFSWIFFRSNSIADAWYILTHLFVGLGSLDLPSTPLDPYQWMSLLAAMGVLCWYEWSVNVPRFVPRGILLDFVLISWIIYFGYFSEQPFIYFQF